MGRELELWEGDLEALVMEVTESHLALVEEESLLMVPLNLVH